MAAFRYLACICAEHATGTPSAETPSPPDPEAVWRLAVRHRVALPVLGRLEKAIRPHQPALADRFRARAKTRGVAALRRAERLATISASLSDAAIAHLAVKGPALAQALYGDVAVRDSKDLDLLVDPAAFEAAAAVLETLGMVPADDPSVTRGSLKKDRLFVGGGVELELHSRLLEVDALLPLGFARIWPRRRTIAIGRTAVPTLSEVDTLLYLCGHGAAHLWFRLKWLEDIARIVAISDAATLEEAMRVARAAGAEAILDAALALVRDLFGIAAAGMRPGVATRSSRAIVALSREALASSAELASSPSLGWILRRLPVQFGMARGWRYRRDLLRMLLLSPHHFDATGLPRGLGWMRLPLRPLMLLRHRWTQSTLRR